MFQSSKTDDGFCCSFNTVSLAEGFAKPERFDDGGDADEDYAYGDYDDYGSYDYGSYDYDYGSGGSGDYGGDYEYESIGGQASFDNW